MQYITVNARKKHNPSHDERSFILLTISNEYIVIQAADENKENHELHL